MNKVVAEPLDGVLINCAFNPLTDKKQSISMVISLFILIGWFFNSF